MSYKSFVSPSTLKQTDKVKLMRWATEHHMPSEPGVAFERWLDALQGVDEETKAKALALSRGWTSGPAAALPHDLVAAEARLGLLGLFALAAAAILAAAGGVVDVAGEVAQQVDDTVDWDRLLATHDESVRAIAERDNSSDEGGAAAGASTSNQDAVDTVAKDGGKSPQELAAAAAVMAPMVARRLMGILAEKASGQLCSLTSFCSPTDIHNQAIESANAYLKELTADTDLHENVQSATLGELTLKCLQNNPEFLQRMQNNKDVGDILTREIIALTTKTGIQESITERVQRVIDDILKYSPTRLNSAGNFNLNLLQSTMRMVANTRLKLYAQGQLDLSTPIQQFLDVYVATNGDELLEFITQEGELADLLEQATGESKVIRAVRVVLREKIDTLLPKKGDFTPHQKEIKKIYDGLVNKRGDTSEAVTEISIRTGKLMKSLDLTSQRLIADMETNRNNREGAMRGDLIKDLRMTLAQRMGPYAFAWIAGVVAALLGVGSMAGGLAAFKRFCNMGTDSTPQNTSHSDVNGPYCYKPGNANPALRGKYAQLYNGRLRHVRTSNGKWGGYPSEDDAHLYLPVHKDANNIWSINYEGGFVELKPAFIR